MNIEKNLKHVKDEEILIKINPSKRNQFVRMIVMFEPRLVANIIDKTETFYIGIDKETDTVYTVAEAGDKSVIKIKDMNLNQRETQLVKLNELSVNDSILVVGLNDHSQSHTKINSVLATLNSDNEKFLLAASIKSSTFRGIYFDLLVKLDLTQKTLKTLKKNKDRFTTSQNSIISNYIL